MTDLRKAAEIALEALSKVMLTSDKGVVCENAAKALRQALAQPEQEPYPEGDVVGPCICGSWPGGKCLKCKRIAPPKREWVGLTDNDLRQIILAAVGVAEAKLKEKNHGPW